MNRFTALSVLFVILGAGAAAAIEEKPLVVLMTCCASPRPGCRDFAPDLTSVRARILDGPAVRDIHPERLTTDDTYMDTEDLIRRIRLGEDSTLELKEVKVRGEGKVLEPHADGVSDELAAMANANGGLLVLGVSDKTKEVSGIPLEHLDRVDAVFEAIVNAVAHRDYSLHSQRIRLFMFRDRLEIHSPGALPNTLSLESMARLSVPRNEVIASLFARYYPIEDVLLGRSYLMDRRGFGVELILREGERLSGRSPFYETIGDLELCLTMYAASLPEESE